MGTSVAENISLESALISSTAQAQHKHSTSHNYARIEFIYLIFALIAGIAVTFIMPMYQVLDAPNHFARAWQISEGKFISPVIERDGVNYLISEVPSVFMNPKYTQAEVYSRNTFSFSDFKNLINTDFNSDDRIIWEISNTGPYSPIVYAPQALGAYIARNLGLSAGWIFYIMRLSALLFSVVCMFLAIKIFPEKALLTFVIGVMPMFLLETGTLTADTVTNCLSILITAFIFSLSRSHEKFTKRQIILLILSAVVLGLIKNVYGTIMLLFFVIPYERSGTRARHYILGIVLLALCLFVSIAWLYISATRFNAHMAVFEKLTPADIANQKEFFMQHPLKVLNNIIRELYRQKIHVIAYFIGISGLMRQWFFAAYAVIIFIAAVSGGMRFKFSSRLLMIAGALITITVTWIYSYLMWFDPAAPEIPGMMHSRYYIPLALMFFSALTFAPKIKHENFTAFFIGLFSIAITLFNLYTYLYL